MKGEERCTLLMHRDDADKRGITTGDRMTVTSSGGHIEVPAEVTEAIMPGVVSIPHGWGHDVAGTKQSVARAHAGVNCNLLTGSAELEPLSGNAILNGVPVEVEPVEQAVLVGPGA